MMIKANERMSQDIFSFKSFESNDGFYAYFEFRIEDCAWYHHIIKAMYSKSQLKVHKVSFKIMFFPRPFPSVGSTDNLFSLIRLSILSAGQQQVYFITWTELWRSS